MIAAITQAEVIRMMLRHLKRAADPPPIAPARACQATCDWVASAHAIARGLRSDVRAAAGCLTMRRNKKNAQKPPRCAEDYLCARSASGSRVRLGQDRLRDVLASGAMRVSEWYRGIIVFGKIPCQEKTVRFLEVVLVLQRGFEMWCNAVHQPCVEGGQHDRTDRNHAQDGLGDPRY